MKCDCGRDFDSYSIDEDLIQGESIEQGGCSNCGYMKTISVKKIKKMVHIGGEN